MLVNICIAYHIFMLTFMCRYCECIMEHIWVWSLWLTLLVSNIYCSNFHAICCTSICLYIANTVKGILLRFFYFVASCSPSELGWIHVLLFLTLHLSLLYWRSITNELVIWTKPSFLLTIILNSTSLVINTVGPGLPNTYAICFKDHTNLVQNERWNILSSSETSRMT